MRTRNNSNNNKKSAVVIVALSCQFYCVSPLPSALSSVVFIDAFAPAFFLLLQPARVCVCVSPPKIYRSPALSPFDTFVVSAA